MGGGGGGGLSKIIIFLFQINDIKRNVYFTFPKKQKNFVFLRKVTRLLEEGFKHPIVVAFFSSSCQYSSYYGSSSLRIQK